MFTIYANGELIYSPNDKTLLVTQPKLTLEMGKAGSLDFHVPPTNPFYEQLGRISTKVSVYEDEETEIFRGRVLSNEREFHNIRSVFCEGDLAYLVDSVQKAEKYTGRTRALFRKIIAAHNARMSSDKRFTVGVIGIEDRDIILTGQSDEIVDEGPIDYQQIIVNSIVNNWNTTYDFIQNSLIDYVGGYLRTRHANGTSYIDLVTDYGVTATQEIRIDSNMLDFLESVSPEDLFTVLIPLGDDNLTIVSVNNGSDELIDATAVAKYGRIVRTQVFPNVNQASTLLENGRRYLANNINVPKTFTIQAVDLHLLNPDISPIHVGDRVKIVSEAHDVTEYMVCTKIEYDLENPANTVYTFGNPKQTLTDRYRKDKRESNNGGSGAIAAAPHDWHLVDETVAEGIETAVEQAGEVTDNKITESYDAWVEWDNGKATINLGTLYKRFKGIDLEQFTTNGINFDGPTGTVNIFADHQQWAADRETLKTNLGIDLDSIAGTINIFATESTVNDLVRRTASLEISLDAITAEVRNAEDALSSRITLNANRITEIVSDIDDLDAALEEANGDITALQGNLAGTQATVDDHSSRFVALAQWQTDTETSISSLEEVSTEHGTRLTALSSWKDDQQEWNALMETRATELGAQATLMASDIDDLGSALADANGDITTLQGNLAGVQATVNEHSSTLASIAQWQSDTSTALTAVTQKADDNEASIQSLTSWKDDTVESIASITQRVSANESSISSVTSVSNSNSTAISSIRQWAGYDAQTGELGSNIALEADLVSVSNRLQAVEGVFSSISAETASISRGLSVNGAITARAFYLDRTASTATQLVAQRHTHFVTDNGDGTYSMGAADPSGNDHPFSIVPRFG